MEHSPRRKLVTLPVSEDVLESAKTLSLNASQAAEAGRREAVREARSRQWLADNKSAITAYNSDVEHRGIAICSLWAKP